MKKNFWLRDRLKGMGIRQWELAEAIGIAESTLVVWLRQELTGEHRERVLAALERIEKRGGTL